MKFLLILVAVAWAQDAEVGSRACAGCHAEIFAKYRLQRQPRLTGARMNLAVAYYRAGNSAAAEAALHKALEYEPDLDAARRMLAELRTAK